MLAEFEMIDAVEPPVCGGPELVERERELCALVTLVAQIRAGSGGVLAIEGRAGAGKTALLDVLAESSERAGALVLRATGAELERQLDWGVVRSLLDGRLGDRAPVPHVLLSIVSELAAARPVALIVDDHHWADAASQRWLAYLINRLAPMPVLVALASRPASGRPEWQAVVARPATTVLSISDLSPLGTARLVHDRLGTVRRGVSEACHHATGGNPFLLCELLAHFERRGERLTRPRQVQGIRPESVRRAVLLQLAQLGAASTDLCFAVAVLGRDATLTLAGELAGLDRAAAVRAADALSGAGVIRVDERLSLAHPLLHDVIEPEIPPAQRADWHLRAAGALISAGAGPSRIAPHLIATAPDQRPEVVSQLRCAAREKIAAGAPEAALACLRRALAEPPLPAELAGTLLELGEVEAVLVERGASEHLRAALELARVPAQRRRIARAIRGLAAPTLPGADEFGREDYAGAQRQIADALEGSAASGSRRARGLALCAGAELQLRLGRNRAAVADARAAASIFIDEPLVRALALCTLAVADGSLGPLERAERLTREQPVGPIRARVLLELGAALRRQGRGLEAGRQLREALDVADRCAAAALVSRAREELRLLGARPRRARLSGAEALTPGERRVCRLAATGSSNREIAQALFLSVRTVETHLTHAYQKLCVNARADLAAALEAELDHSTSKSSSPGR